MLSFSGSTCSLYKDRMHIYALLSSQLVSQLKNKILSFITKIVTKNQDRNLDILAKNKVFGGIEPERLSE